MQKPIRVCLLLLLALEFAATSADAQWPPSGVTPAQPLEHLKLPGGRFVPSTRRWNLVWADQIIPSNVTPARVKFAAEHYVGTQKIFASQATEFRAVNPNFLIVSYHLAAGLNPLHNDDCPDPKSQKGNGVIGIVGPKGYVSEYKEYFQPWLASHSIAEAGSQFEAMFQHYDALDPQHRVWHQDPYWLMDLSNSDWRNYLTDVSLDWLRGNANEGMFFDVAVETNAYLYNPKASNPSPGNFDWWAPPHGPAGEDRTAFSSWMNKRYRECYQNIYKHFHTDSVDYLVLPNTDQMVTTVYDPLWTDGDAAGETIDGGMMEGFGSYRGQDMWLTLERGLRHITCRGKMLIAQFYGVDSIERMRRTAMYMLIKNENSFLNILNADGVEWYPEYEIDLGDQSRLPSTLDSLRVAGSGWQSVWARDYARGRVYVNTSDVAMQAAVPDVGQWAQVISHGGGKVNDDGTPLPQSLTYMPVAGNIMIPASGARILSRRDLGSVKTSGEDKLFSLTINPNPVRDFVKVSLKHKVARIASLSIFNIRAQCVVTVFSGLLEAGEHTWSWNARGMAPGAYFCVLRFATGESYRSIFLVD